MPTPYDVERPNSAW